MRVVRIGLKDNSSLVGGRRPSAAWLQHIGSQCLFLGVSHSLCQSGASLLAMSMSC